MTAEARTSAWGAKSRRRLRQFCVANTGHCLFQKCVNGFEREQSSAHHAAKSAFADSDPSCQSSVLLRVARPDALAPIAEPQPPDRQLRQIVKAVGTGESKPLSLRIAAGRPRSAKIRWKASNTPCSRVDSKASQASRKREAWSVTSAGNRSGRRRA
jgi:hypothetical protein